MLQDRSNYKEWARAVCCTAELSGYWSGKKVRGEECYLCLARMVPSQSDGPCRRLLPQVPDQSTFVSIKMEDYLFAATITKIEDLSLDEVHSKVLETEVCRKGDTDSAANLPCIIPAPTSSFSSFTSPKKSKGPRGACYICDRDGHWVRKCPQRRKKKSTARDDDALTFGSRRRTSRKLSNRLTDGQK